MTPERLAEIERLVDSGDDVSSGTARELLAELDRLRAVVEASTVLDDAAVIALASRVQTTWPPYPALDDPTPPDPPDVTDPSWEDPMSRKQILEDIVARGTVPMEVPVPLPGASVQMGPPGVPPARYIAETGHTIDRNDPGLHVDRGDGQNQTYLVLSDEERGKGFVRPYRDTYVHSARPASARPCGAATKMSRPISETYARNPSFYGSTFCVGCGTHYPVEEFTWDGTDLAVGS